MYKRDHKRSLIILSLFILFTLNSKTVWGAEEMKKNLISLPEPELKGKVSLEETIKKRRSVRSYSDKELTPKELSQLLWAAQGITDIKGHRAAPSAGAVYPLEIYVVKEDGLFLYRPRDHILKPVSGRDLRQQLSDAALGQNFIAKAPVTIVISAVNERIRTRYGERGIRYTHIEVGHVAENIHLQAVALGLSSVPVGAFDDNAVSSVLNIPKWEKPLYIIPVGHEG